MDKILFLACVCVLVNCVSGRTCADPVMLTATSEFQYLQSHNAYGTANYNNNQYSCWIIEATEEHTVMLNVTAFSLYDPDKCSFQQGDRVNLYDGESNDDGLVFTACEKYAIWPVTTTDRYAYIEFITDTEGTADGFNIGYIESGSILGEESSMDSTDFEDFSEEPFPESSNGGLIGFIVIAVLFGLAIIAGITGCVIACIVIAWNEKNSARTQGIVHGANDNHTSQPDTTNPAQEEPPRFFTGNRSAAAASNAPIFSNAQLVASVEAKKVPKGPDVVQVATAQDAPPEYMP